MTQAEVAFFTFFLYNVYLIAERVCLCRLMCVLFMHMVNNLLYISQLVYSGINQRGVGRGNTLSILSALTFRTDLSAFTHLQLQLHPHTHVRLIQTTHVFARFA